MTLENCKVTKKAYDIVFVKSPVFRYYIFSAGAHSGELDDIVFYSSSRHLMLFHTRQGWLDGIDHGDTAVPPVRGVHYMSGTAATDRNEVVDHIVSSMSGSVIAQVECSYSQAVRHVLAIDVDDSANSVKVSKTMLDRGWADVEFEFNGTAARAIVESRSWREHDAAAQCGMTDDMAEELRQLRVYSCSSPAEIRKAIDLLQKFYAIRMATEDQLDTLDSFDRLVGNDRAAAIHAIEK